MKFPSLVVSPIELPRFCSAAELTHRRQAPRKIPIHPQYVAYRDQILYLKLLSDFRGCKKKIAACGSIYWSKCDLCQDKLNETSRRTLLFAYQHYEFFARWLRNSLIEAKRIVPCGNSASMEPST